MKITQLMVQLSKQVSNGNYGNEKVDGQWLATLEPGDDPIACMHVLLDRGREQLLHHLSRSENRNVRLAVNPSPRLCESCRQLLSDEEEYEHAACREQRMDKQRRDAEARRADYAAARAPVAAGSAVDDDEDDEDDEDGEDPF